MKAVIDLNECLRDSPKFRQELNQNEDNIDILEVKLEKVRFYSLLFLSFNRLLSYKKVIKLCNAMVETGKAFIKSKSSFINSVWEVSVYFNEDPSIVSPLNKIINTLTELMKYQQMLLDQTHRAVSRSLDTFIKNDINKVKETKRHFDKISDDYDTILVRNSQTFRSKQNECEEVHNLLTATRSCFKHTTLDYVSQICCLQSRKRHEVLHSFLSLMQAYGTYFHQGSDLFQDFDPVIKETANYLNKLRDDSISLQKQLDGNHSLVTKDTTVTVLTKGNQVWIEGYLFKRTSNAFKTWNRRWFIVKDSQLVYQKKNEIDFTIMEEDLRLCRVKPLTDIERRFCFEIISPSKSHVLQADSEEACRIWVNTLKHGIDAAYNDSSSNENQEAVSIESLDSIGTNASCATANQELNDSAIPKFQRPHLQILAMTGNEVCCDCRSPETKWASINLGITLCIECSGIHRSLGVHISKVRSLFLDDWDNDTTKVMLSLGNAVVNQFYEANVNENIAKRATHDSDRTERENWIKAKYVLKAFVDRSVNKCNNIKTNSSNEEDLTNNMESESDLKLYFNKMLYVAASNADIVGICEALAKGADINWSNEEDEGKRILHQVVLSGNLVATEFVFLNGAKCNLQDSFNRTALHLATELSNTGLVCALLKRGADQSILDNQNRDAVTIAVNNANADIVTLLRLAKLNEEMKNDEYGNSHEGMFNEIVRDFSNLSSMNPKSKHESIIKANSP
ncbi:hypothetical protein B4U79_12687 [Dinothrombium tinctorium]|uniref:Uncharacterized protein n=1 Tax=Dinothrombium tinctorium TaxID=1965070 RepID=A0A3S3S436_9ACAR|nr:hypothetical protein B4U79_02502 [Dinothrombium tinctorium]RWS08888.1 hypothetical protein B4U79_12687 [Dinothrombium tinctorium]